LSRNFSRPWYLYLLEGEGGKLYAGISPDVGQRFALHRAGTASAFTRANRPVRILAAQEFPDQGSATSAELALKRLPRSLKLRWAQSNPWKPTLA